jgi:hypothetical protein
MRLPDTTASTRKRWQPTALVAFALVFVLVWVLRGLLSLVAAGAGWQQGMWNLFRVLIVVGDAIVVLGGLALVGRPTLVGFRAFNAAWSVRIFGAVILCLGIVGTVSSWLYFSIIDNQPPLSAFLATWGPLLPIVGYVLLMALIVPRRVGNQREID